MFLNVVIVTCGCLSLTLHHLYMRQSVSFVNFKPHSMLDFLQLGRLYLDEVFSSSDVIREAALEEFEATGLQAPPC